MTIISPVAVQKHRSSIDLHHFYTLVEKHAEASPDSVAIYHGDIAITYRELNQISNQVARYLQKRNVGAESLVGLFMERTPEAVICMLGILKAGGAYLPIDPTHPADRIAYIAEDAKVEMILSNSRLMERFPEWAAKAVCIDKAWTTIAEEDDGPVKVNVDGDNLAYVMYTSGSTGKPKGVEVPRRAVNNFICSLSQYPGINRHERLLSLTTLSFDISVLEIFLPLYAGASVVIADQQSVLDGNRLAAMMEQFEVTFMQATPATWFMLMEAGWQGNKRLKALCGGEAMPRELANKLVSLCGSVWNMYGPTETTVWSTLAQLSVGEGAVPIGKPLDNTEILILDEHLRPVQPGETGEIYIGGAGVARGYRGKPELTRERFIDYDDQATGRLTIYKTGDLGKVWPDGNFECIGRADFQVKLRGFRIELGEIEAALESLPSVRQAIVILKEISPSDKKLIAFYRPEAAAVSADEWRNHLKKVLPDYMIPTFFEPIQAFPLTPNGKVDRKALMERQLTVGFGKRVVVPPSKPVEIEVAKIWEELLKVTDISIHDSFLELGGHSLLASMMIHRVNQTFNVALSLIEVLTNGLTIAELTSLIEDKVVEAASDDDIASALGMLENLSEEEIEALLKKAGI